MTNLRLAVWSDWASKSLVPHFWPIRTCVESCILLLTCRRELAKKRSGSGSFIVDDQRKYPNKESLGPLSAQHATTMCSPWPRKQHSHQIMCQRSVVRPAGGVVGGFAGGEQGVRQFVEEGTIKLADRSRQPQSPLYIAVIVAIAGTIGGLLFFSVRTDSQQCFGEG